MVIMKKLKILACSFFFLSSMGLTQSTPYEVVNKDLEQNVSWLLKTKPTKKKVLDKLGKPALDEKSKIFYALNDFKYSLSIEFSNTGFSYLNYKVPPKTKLSILDFAKFFKSEDFSPYPADGHEKGRYLSVMLKPEKLLLIFNNNSEKKLARIIYDQK